MSHAQVNLIHPSVAFKEYPERFYFYLFKKSLYKHEEYAVMWVWNRSSGDDSIAFAFPRGIAMNRKKSLLLILHAILVLTA